MQIVLTENCTADGVIDMDAGWFDPAEQADDDRLVAALQAQMGEEHAVLLGRRDLRVLPELLAPPDRRHHRHHRPPEPSAEVRALDDAAGSRVEPRRRSCVTSTRCRR